MKLFLYFILLFFVFSNYKYHIKLKNKSVNKNCSSYVLTFPSVYVILVKNDIKIICWSI